MNKPQDNLIVHSLKKIISRVPAIVPVKIYKTLGILPPCKFIMDKVILSSIPKRISIPEGELELDQTDVAVSGTLSLGAFENTEMEVFRRSIKSGMNIVDIGAHIGYYTVVAGKRVGPKGKVFSFEPEENNFTRLKRNIEINSLSNITAVPMALSDKEGSCLFNIDTVNKGHHSIANNDDDLSSLDLNTGRNRVSIKTTTLDQSLKRFGQLKIGIVKMDVEGAEFLILKGMKETLARNKELILFTEFYPREIRRLGGNPLKYLTDIKELGFSLSLINENKKRLEPIVDLNKFVDHFPGGDSFYNIYCKRSD